MTVINDTCEFIPKDDVVSDEDKPTLEKLVERGVALKREINILKDNLADVASDAKELFGISKRDFNALVKYSFEASIAADIEWYQTIESKLKNLGDSNQGELFEDQDD